MSSPSSTSPRGASFERVLAALRSLGITAKQAHGGASSKCPMPGHKHDDRNPSLSIQYIDRDGRTRLRCHMPEHKGREEDILAELGLVLRDLYDEPKTDDDRGRPGGHTTGLRPQALAAPKPAPAAEPKPKKARGKVVDSYDYVDAQGHNLLRVLRFEPKGFSQKQWDGRQWVRGAPPAEARVLYRLPEVRAVCEAGGIIHLTEGEKDADAIAAALNGNGAATATTAPMGADKWQPHYAKQLLGASKVHIWRDRDDAGTSQARTVHASLTEAGIPADVVEAAVEQDKADAADHLAGGFTLDQAIIVDPARYSPQPPASLSSVPDDTTEQDTPAAETASVWPARRFPMGRGAWAFDHGEHGEGSRGVWTKDALDKPWRWIAPLPHVHARIICRDGAGRPTGTDYLISVEADSRPVIIDREQLHTAVWANVLGLPLSADSKIQQAAATAIQYAALEAPEREATPRVQDGQVTIPTPETLPPGYLQTAHSSPEEARSGWADLIILVAQSPQMALVVGASAVAPFVAATRRKSHIVALYGDAVQGKTVALQTASAIWGLASNDPHDGDATVMQTWNTSAQGPNRVLGDLGVLPPIFDEIGEAGFKGPVEWGKFIYNVTNGATRITPARGSTGTNYSKPWRGVFIAAGNGRILEGLGAGRYAGVARRVVELPCPFTQDAEHSEAIERLWHVVYGHAGYALLNHHSADSVLPLIEQAAATVGAPESSQGEQMARHVHAHVAGAAMLDQWAGTGTTLQDAAAIAASDYLDQWAEPEHDADRMIRAVREGVAREPAMWPTTSVYTENRQPRPGWTPPEMVDLDSVRLPQHGVDRSMCGIRHDDDEWVAVFTSTWKAICEDLGLDGTVAARELHARGVLHVTEAKRRRGEWVSQMRVAGTGMYKLTLPNEDDDDDEPASVPAPPASQPVPTPAEPSVVGESPVRCGSGVGGPEPLTSDVVGVVGVVGDSTRTRGSAREVFEMTALDERQPCTVCGEDASHNIDGQPMHAICQPEPTPQPQLVAPERPQEPPADTSPPNALPSPQSGTQQPQTHPCRSRWPWAKRWNAPAAVVSLAGGHLPSGELRALPEIKHLGHLAELTRKNAFNLGWGGTADCKPDTGQVWVAADWLAAYDLPATLPTEKKARDKALRALNQHPFVAGALADGWVIKGQGHLRGWTDVYHPQHHSTGARIVFWPWEPPQDVPILKDKPHPAELATRLGDVAEALGITYRMTPGTTGHDLIDHTRPPKEDERDTKGARHNRAALIKNQPAELPDFLRATNDLRFRNLEADFMWWRLWRTLGVEQRLRYVHAYDRGASYLSPWRGIPLGLDDLIHRTGSEATWDRSDRPGYFRIKAIKWERWNIPCPISRGAYVEDDTVWVTVHTLKQLALFDIEAEVLESYTWGHTGKYLEIAGTRIRQGLDSLPEGPTRKLVKKVYSDAVGKFSQVDHKPEAHLWRPDWHHHIKAHTRLGILLTVQRNGNSTGRWPLVVDRDLLVYASDDPNPVTAWPGKPDTYGTTPGKWKHEGSAELATWGPAHLAKEFGLWNYNDAIADLTL